ncbi:hypothetical protein AURDEDRAFT_178842 [Auricularia subglabra TFB-10046 SS5]|nr:hypothetical protein AURDEDRAFT_178842 [Auricularia subglabra TFB-10046 SS5]
MASTGQLKRMSSRSQPRTTRYRYVVNDLPPPPPLPALPPPTGELPAVPQSSSDKPPRPRRSSSRPTPTPSRAASPAPGTDSLTVPSLLDKRTRRRSRSLGSLPPPPPYDAHDDSPYQGRHGAAASTDHLGRSTSPPGGDLGLKKSLRTIRRMSRSLTQLRARARAQSTERGPPPSSAYKPLVTVIPPMPDIAPPLPSDEPLSSGTTSTARPSPSPQSAASSLGRAPPLVRSAHALTPPDQMANPRPAPKPPTSNATSADPPMPLAARDDSAVREQVQGIKLRRISRSYTNLRLMATPDSLQAEAQTNRELQLRADRNALTPSPAQALEHARSRSPRPLPAPPPVPATSKDSPQKASAPHPATSRRILPAPPSTPPSAPLPTPPVPAPAPVGEQPQPAARKSRGLIAASAARLKAISPMAMMSTFAPSRPSSRDSTSSRTTASSHSHSYSSHTTSSSGHTTASSSAHSHSHSYSHSPPSTAPSHPPFAGANRMRSSSAASNASITSRLVIPIPRGRPRGLPPAEVYTPIDPVVAPNNRISFLKPAMVKPYMGQRF